MRFPTAAMARIDLPRDRWGNVRLGRGEPDLVRHSEAVEVGDVGASGAPAPGARGTLAADG